jgi:hypothetical protein
VLNGAVELLDNGHAMVASQSEKGVTAYTLTNGSCECVDFASAPQGQCKHRLARGIAIRATQIAKELGQAESPVTLTPDDLASDLEAEPVPVPPAVTIPPQFLVTIQGKPFITSHGLLHLAHQQGLLSLSARFISVTADLAWPKRPPCSTTGARLPKPPMPRLATSTAASSPISPG